MNVQGLCSVGEQKATSVRQALKGRNLSHIKPTASLRKQFLGLDLRLSIQRIASFSNSASVNPNVVASAEFASDEKIKPNSNFRKAPVFHDSASFGGSLLSLEDDDDFVESKSQKKPKEKVSFEVYSDEEDDDDDSLELFDDDDEDDDEEIVEAEEKDPLAVKNLGLEKELESALIGRGIERLFPIQVLT